MPDRDYYRPNDEEDRYRSARARYLSPSTREAEFGTTAREMEGREMEAYRRWGGQGPRGPHAGKGPRTYLRSDQRIWEDINDRLTDDASIDATDIQVEVNEGLVTLKGGVLGRYEKRLAEDIAWSVSGVRDVRNELRAGQSMRGQPAA